MYTQAPGSWLPKDQRGMRKLNDVGYWLLKQKEVDAAISIFEYMVESNPDSADAHDALGEACELTGDIDRAIECYRRALDLDPNCTHAAEALKKLGAD